MCCFKEFEESGLTDQGVVIRIGRFPAHTSLARLGACLAGLMDHPTLLKSPGGDLQSGHDAKYVKTQ